MKMPGKRQLQIPLSEILVNSGFSFLSSLGNAQFLTVVRAILVLSMKSLVLPGSELSVDKALSKREKG